MARIPLLSIWVSRATMEKISQGIILKEIRRNWLRHSTLTFQPWCWRNPHWIINFRIWWVLWTRIPRRLIKWRHRYFRKGRVRRGRLHLDLEECKRVLVVVLIKIVRFGANPRKCSFYNPVTVNLQACVKLKEEDWNTKN